MDFLQILFWLGGLAFLGGLTAIAIVNVNNDRKQKLHLSRISSFNVTFGIDPGPIGESWTSRGKIVQTSILAELAKRERTVMALCDQQNAVSRNYPVHLASSVQMNVVVNDLAQFDRLQKEIDGAKAALAYARFLAEHFGYETSTGLPPY